MEITEAATLCKKHVHRYVLIKMNDGMVYDGIIESVEKEHVVLAVPATDEAAMPIHAGHHGPGCGCGSGGMYRPTYQGGYQGGGYGHHGHGGDPFYPGGFGPGYYGPGFYGPGFYGPRRRFNRVILPLAAFTALSLLPYF